MAAPGNISDPMNSTYEIVRYEPGLKKQVIDLQFHLWSPTAALNTAYFEWKFERNPYVAEPLAYIAMHNGKAVGMRGFFGMQLEGGIPTQRSIVPCADDLVIAPEHRNRGLIPRIMSASFEDLAKLGYRYVFNLGAGSITFLSSLATGWRSVGLMQPMRRPSWQSDLRHRRDALIQRLPKIIGRGDRFARRWLERKRASLADIRAERAKRRLSDVPWIHFENFPRSAAMAELAATCGDSRIRHVRDREYFDWCFQNPLSRYRFLFWEKARLEGYLVLQESASHYAKDVVNIVDWEARSLAIQADLLKAALKVAGNRNLNIWSVSLPSQATGILEANGFELEPPPRSATQRRRALLVRSVHDEEPPGDMRLADQPLFDMKSWDLRMLYALE